MTSEEIRSTSPNFSGTSESMPVFWLKEIALQLALFVEHLREADAAVFGTAQRNNATEKWEESQRRIRREK